MTDVPTLFDLAGKVALVTGATKGIGRAMAEGLAGAGAAVVVSSRKQHLCDDVAADIAATTGARTLPVACHVGDWSQCDHLVDTVHRELGRIDVLVNNAGINPASVPVADMTEELFDKVHAVNLKGPLRLAGRVAPLMREQGGGSIVNVTTIGAYGGGPGQAAYTSSKAALVNLSKIMAAEWARWGIRVNTLAPGPFMTEMMRGAELAQPGFHERSASATLLRRIADPDEIVGAVLFLASDASSYMTGEDLVIAGGMRRG